jgi:ABC-type uncharacterized transport system
MKKTITLLTLMGILLIGYQYPYTLDMTDHRYNSLLPAAQSLLSTLHEPLSIELVSPDPDLRNKVQQTVALFKAHSPHLSFIATRKRLEPAEKTRLGLESHHHLLLKTADQFKAMDLDGGHFGQKPFTQALYQMLRRNQKWTLFLEGHGEAEAFGKDNKGLHHLSKDLKNKGIRIASLNIGTTGVIPDNTQLLVIAHPRSPLLAKEMAAIHRYIEKGGNLLWFAGPDQPAGFEALALMLGVRWSGGLIMDPESHALGTPDPAISLVQHYPPHPLNTLNQLTVFPWSTPIEATQAAALGWDVLPVLLSNEQSYLQGHPHKKGPFNLGMTLRKGTQRVVLLGSAHCFNNATLHNYGNLQWANNLFNWLNDADLFIADKPAPQADLALTPPLWFYRTARYVFPYGLPLLYLCIGWHCRRAKALKTYQPTMASPLFDL